MKYLIIVLVVLMFGVGGYVYKSNQDKRESYRQHMAQYEQQQQQNKIDQANAERDQKNAEAKAELDRIKQNEKNAQAKRDEQIEAVKVAEIAVKATLFDPSSAQFRNQKGNCGEVNGKNRMGGYVGFSRYVYSPSDKTVAVESEAKDSEYPRYVMDDLWKKSCN